MDNARRRLAARRMRGSQRQLGQAGVGKTERLQAPHCHRLGRQAAGADFLLGIDDDLELGQEPRVEAGNGVDPLDRKAVAQGLGCNQQPVGRRPRQRSFDPPVVGAVELAHAIEPAQPRFQAAQRLLQALGERPADRHHFADRLHRGRQQWRRALELFKGEARDLGDDIIDRRLEARRGRSAGDVVGDLVQSIADRKLGRDLGDRESGGLGRQRGGSRDARVHLDHHHPPGLGIDCELDVGTACFDTDFAQHRNACRTHALIVLVGQGQRRGDGDRVAGMHPHRVDILDRADDDGVVGAVAHHLHLKLLPADQAFVDQHFGRRRRFQAGTDEMLIFLAVVGNPAARPAEREAGADDGRQADMLERRPRLVHRMDDRGSWALQPDPVHRVAEFLPVLGLLDRLRIGADQFDPKPLQSAVLGQRQRGVERGLPAHRRQHRVRPLLLDDACNKSRRDRLDIGRIRHLRVGHDRRRVGIDDDHAIALGLQRLDGLRPRIIELRRLPDDDRAGADDEDGGNVGAAGHQRIIPTNFSNR